MDRKIHRKFDNCDNDMREHDEINHRKPVIARVDN